MIVFRFSPELVTTTELLLNTVRKQERPVKEFLEFNKEHQNPQQQTV
jgi:hypothetical protein